MRLCFIGDPRSVHTLRWVGWFAREHDVHLIRTAPSKEELPWPGIVLPQRGALPGSRLLGSVRAVRRYVRESQPDVVNGHFINEAGWFAALSGHPAVVVSAWGSDLYRAPHESRLAAVLNPWSARKARLVTCDSRDQAGVLERWGVPPERVRVVGWGVDLAAFSPEVDGMAWRKRLGIPANGRVVLSPRQWLPNSRIHEVLEAFEALPGEPHLILKRLPQFEGEYGAEVEARVRGAALGGRVHVVEEVAEAELPGLYAAADCVASLCETDGTPMSVLEAMASGLPVVAFRNASLSEWVTEEGGGLVDGIEPARVAPALGRALEQGRAGPAGRHNRALVERKADRQRELGAMERAYLELAGLGGR